MKRPSCQAKLVFLGLFRTVSALAGATEPTRGGLFWNAASAYHHGWAGSSSTQTSSMRSSSSSVTSSAAGESQSLLSSTTLTLRLARRTDVPSIQRCNLACLPENYNSAFYVDHLRQWPELSLVVVDDEPPQLHQQQQHLDSHPNMDLMDQHRITTHSANNGFSSSAAAAFSGSATTPSSRVIRHGVNNFYPFMGAASDTGAADVVAQSNVVAYVLGKVEQRRVDLPPNDDNLAYWPGRPLYRVEDIGHVTSLAVLDDYRRRGLAQQLMEQLHYQLRTHYGHAQQVGLHVRKSNHAATHLYSRLGYERTEAIPSYYQDGEDGYFMIKSMRRPDEATASQDGQRQYGIVDNNNHHHHPGGSGGIFGHWRRQSQPTQNVLSLPRKVGVGRPNANMNLLRNNHSDEETELMSGSF